MLLEVDYCAGLMLLGLLDYCAGLMLGSLGYAGLMLLGLADYCAGLMLLRVIKTV